eukprot:PITA_09913
MSQSPGFSSMLSVLYCHSSSLFRAGKALSMSRSPGFSSMLSVQCIFTLSLLCILVGMNGASGVEKNIAGEVSALFVFGDSIVDAGNNNYISTIAKADFPPYGRDLVNHKPTGRFSNGKLSTDFIAAGLGLKETLPPYLDPHLTTQDLITGVSFASGGTGYDNLTAEVASVIPIWKQLEFFRDYSVILGERVGKEKTSTIIRKAIFLSCAGTNDFIKNYFLLPIRRKQFSITQYQDFLLQLSQNFIQDLYNLGARKFGIYGMAPPGCLPEQKMLYGNPKLEGCMDELNEATLVYNIKLKAAVASLKARLPDIKVVYIDIYDAFIDIVRNPAKYGFETSNRGCCGTGYTEVGITCNSNISFICPDASKYVFWDAVHSTEKTYHLTAKMVLDNYISQLLS